MSGPGQGEMDLRKLHERAPMGTDEKAVRSGPRRPHDRLWVRLVWCAKSHMCAEWSRAERHSQHAGAERAPRTAQMN